jgi:hypothetical protein
VKISGYLETIVRTIAERPHGIESGQRARQLELVKSAENPDEEKNWEWNSD